MWHIDINNIIEPAIAINDTLLFEISVIAYYSGRFVFALALDQNCLKCDSLKNDDENNNRQTGMNLF